jgi:fructose-bisphosphate aldolase class II
MALHHPQELLTRAYAAGYAVPSRRAASLEEARLFADAAAAAESPAEIRLAWPHGGEDLAPDVLRLASQSEVPLILHGECGEQPDLVRAAAEAGCAAVSVDGSRLDFDDNLALTAEAVRAAWGAGAWVQGALDLDPSGPGAAPPEEAGRFTEQSGCQALKVLQYRAEEPSFDLLVRLSSVLQVFPLVLRPARATLLEAGSEPEPSFGPPPDPRLTQICRLGVCVAEMDELDAAMEGFSGMFASIAARALKSWGQAQQPMQDSFSHHLEL